jgi:peptide/nickel transport system permease protein
VNGPPTRHADLNPGADAALEPAAMTAHPSPWPRAVQRLLDDRTALAGLAVVAVFAGIAIGVWLGWWGGDWAATGPERWAPPSPQHWLGTTLIGQDILARAIASTATAFEVGLTVSIGAVVLGALLGTFSGYLAHTPVDGIVLWAKGVLDSIPFYLFVAALAFALDGHPLAMHAAMIASFWTTTARLVRAETIRLKGQQFVEAARGIGLGTPAIVARHLLPNTMHILLVQFTIVFVAAVKTEVVLSFLGLGVQDGISWGVMIAEAGNEVVGGRYMNFVTASGFLFALVMGLNLLADGLQDALDPKGSRR